LNNSSHILVGGMVNQLNKMDKISHNLANLNTTGFKQQNITEETYSTLLSGYPKKDLNYPANTSESADFINQTLNMVPHASREFINQKNGAFTITGNEYDLAITEQNTFFIVMDPDTKKTFLTRNGAFVVKGEQLFTKDGKIVLDRQLNPVNTEAGYETQLATISYDYDKLDARGDSSFALKDNKEILISEIDDFKEGIVITGSLETSNVNAVLEMTSMIETQRLFEQFQKALKTSQELDRQSTNTIGNNKG
jgi:flagellar basal-body rod protein FlgF